MADVMTDETVTLSTLRAGIAYAYLNEVTGASMLLKRDGGLLLQFRPDPRKGGDGDYFPVTQYSASQEIDDLFHGCTPKAVEGTEETRIKNRILGLPEESSLSLADVVVPRSKLATAR